MHMMVMFIHLFIQDNHQLKHALTKIQQGLTNKRKCMRLSCLCVSVSDCSEIQHCMFVATTNTAECLELNVIFCYVST